MRITSLPGAAKLFIVTWVIHTADHARRGLAATTDAVAWSGTMAALLAAISITLIFVRHPTAPAIAAAVFTALTIGVAGTHLPPGWGPLSDPLIVESNTDVWSILAASAEMVAAALLAAVALRILARNAYSWHITNWATSR